MGSTIGRSDRGLLSNNTFRRLVSTVDRKGSKVRGSMLYIIIESSHKSILPVNVTVWTGPSWPMRLDEGTKGNDDGTLSLWRAFMKRNAIDWIGSDGTYQRKK
jgi:hypothetical protein